MKKTSTSHGDERMIGNRDLMNFEVSHYNLLRNDEEYGDSTSEMSDIEYADQLAQTLFGESRVKGALENEKILSIKKKPLSIQTYDQKLSVSYSEEPSIPRTIDTKAIRTLAAPNIDDNFYFNLVDWSEKDKLALAIESSLFIVNEPSVKIGTPTQPQTLFKLDIDEEGYRPIITSVHWLSSANIPTVAVGTCKGEIHIWDVERGTQVRNLRGHTESIRCFDNHGHILSSGSLDSTIINWDLRVRNARVSVFQGEHAGGVCSLKWHQNGRVLASGIEDKQLNLWSVENNSLINSLDGHTTTVKAIAWCPFRSNIIASGGGLGDGSIKFWNSDTQTLINTIDTKNQVTSLLWSKNTREIISAHGYESNSINVWHYPSRRHVAELKGHAKRVLTLCHSPNSENILSLSADETIKFWSIRDDRATKPTPVKTPNKLFIR